MSTVVKQSNVLESIHTKCGELFISNKGEFLFYCSFWFCNEQFKTFHHFAIHLFEQHYSRLNIIELPQQQNNNEAANNIADDGIICISDTDDEKDEISTESTKLEESRLEEYDSKELILKITKGNCNDNQSIEINSIVCQEEIVQQTSEDEISSISSVFNEQVDKTINNIENINQIKKRNDIVSNKKRKKTETIIYNNEHKLKKASRSEPCSISYNESSDDNDNLECKICGKILLSDTGLKSHMKRHENENFNKKNIKIIEKNIKDNIKNNINRNNDIENNGKIYQCSYCDDKFKSKPYFIKHELNHINDNKIYKCDLCHQAYFSKNTLKLHKLIHTENRMEFQCDICNKKILTERYLQIHKLKHKNKLENLLQCNYCDLKYSEKYLPVHELIHTDGLKYKCKSCDKKFLTKGHLKAHELKHNDKKEFVCEICQMRFFTKGNLDIHKYSHLKKKNNKKLKISNGKK